MSHPRSARWDWRGWRSEVVERLDRRTIAAAVAFAALLVAFTLLTGFNGAIDARRVLRIVAATFADVMTIFVVLIVAVVAVARGASRWIAYPIAAGIAAITALAIFLFFDPNDWLVKMTSQRWATFSYFFYLSLFAVPAIVCVYHSNAAHSTNALRRLESERAAEAERLARQRLQAELATIDHDLVLAAMRLARTLPPKQAEALLTAVTTYLRAAQQRDSTDPLAVASALAELRAMCARSAGGPAQQVAA